MGVVYHANYLLYFEIGRTELLRDRGLAYRALEDRGIFLPVVETGVQYKGQARYDDDLEIRTTVELASPVRIRFEYEAWRSEDLLAEGFTVLACLGDDRRPKRLPDDVLAHF
jgi:acyl-CoA thioester hydrolase